MELSFQISRSSPSLSELGSQDLFEQSSVALFAKELELPHLLVVGSAIETAMEMPRKKDLVSLMALAVSKLSRIHSPSKHLALYLRPNSDFLGSDES